MKLITCSSNPAIAQAIAENLGTSLVDAEVKTFRDSEVSVEINENVRGEDVYVIQSTSNPANEHLMELFITVDALRRASARRITAVIPYFGYARQDRKSAPRTPITAKLVANLITTSGVDRVLTMDLHAGQVQGFFDIPLDNLYASPIFARDIRENGLRENGLVVSPDAGGVVRARELAKRIEFRGDGADLAIIDKRRPKAGESKVMHVIGDVAGKDCIFIDDLCDSGGTLCNAAAAIMEHGANSVTAYVSHGVFSGPALENITNSVMKEVVITDTIAQPDGIQQCEKIRTISVAPLFANAIDRIAEEKSVSSLFKSM